MTKLVNGFCIKCHGQDDPEGDLRLDRLNASFFEDADEEHARTLRLLEEVELIELLTYPQVSTSLG